MSDYTVIAEAGNALVRLLRKELVPDFIRNAADIGLVSPADRGDMTVCVHLYDVSESETYRVSGMISDGAERQKFPPIYLTLSYMITIFSAGDVKFRSVEEQRILGKVAQVLRDCPILNLDTMEFGMGGGEEQIRIEMLRVDLDEKVKAWSFPNLAAKPSLFYRMDPVALESARTKNVRRVQEIEFKRDDTEIQRNDTTNPFVKFFRRNRS